MIDVFAEISEVYSIYYLPMVGKLHIYINDERMKIKKGNLLIGFAILLAMVVVLTLIGLFALRKEPIVLQGQVEASVVRVSGKVAGRILDFTVREGDKVSIGDTLVLIDSPEVNARLRQAMAAEDAAKAQSVKAVKGARKEVVAGAYEQWQKALVGLELAKKSFDRVQNLFNKGVVPAQKCDEAQANYQAAEASAKAAQSQYDMAKNGAELEDKESAAALLDRARGAVDEVSSYVQEASLLAPISGEVSDVFLKKGELVGAGAPIMNLVDLDDSWVVFNVREDLLSKLTMGKQFQARVPALNNELIGLHVSYIKAMASYANWKATKVSGQYDSKTFEVRARPVVKVKELRPGMTVLVDWEKL